MQCNAYVRTCVRTHVRTYARANDRRHARARTHMRAHARTCARTHAHARARTHMRAHERTRARTHRYTHAHKHERTNARARARTYIQMSSLFLIQCTKTCGKGVSKRSVVCREENSYRVVSDSKCYRKRRLRSKKKCNLRDCVVKKNITKKKNHRNRTILSNKSTRPRKVKNLLSHPRRNRKTNIPNKHSQMLYKILNPLLVKISGD